MGLRYRSIMTVFRSRLIKLRSQWPAPKSILCPIAMPLGAQKSQIPFNIVSVVGICLVACSRFEGICLGKPIDEENDAIAHPFIILSRIGTCEATNTVLVQYHMCCPNASFTSPIMYYYQFELRFTVTLEYPCDFVEFMELNSYTPVNAPFPYGIIIGILTK